MEIADCAHTLRAASRRAAVFRYYSAQELCGLRFITIGASPRGLALYLKEQGQQPGQIALRLAQSGHFPEAWRPVVPEHGAMTAYGEPGAVLAGIAVSYSLAFLALAYRVSGRFVMLARRAWQVRRLTPIDPMHVRQNFPGKPQVDRSRNSLATRRRQTRGSGRSQTRPCGLQSSPTLHTDV